MGHDDENRLGRKRVSSRAMIEEAACELFLENTYAGTTVEEIAQRAGISRNTFFNYFPAKSDVLWSSVDVAVDALEAEFGAVVDDTAPLVRMRDALLRVSARFGPGQLPLAVSQLEVMGTHNELTASGLTRFLRMAGILERYLDERMRRGAPATEQSRTIAYALVAATVAAGSQWVDAGTSRNPLAEYVDEAITPICRGFTVAGADGCDRKGYVR